MIKTIIFDLNKVIVTYDHSDEKYLIELGINREDFWKNREDDLYKYNMGEISLDSFLLNQITQSNLSNNKLDAVRKLHEEGLRLVEGIVPILENLSKRYALILMAGEGMESLNLKIKLFNLNKYFSKIYATCISKISKTDGSFYKLILEESKLDHSEVIFIDDYASHINAAASIGIKTIKFENAKQLNLELSSLLS